MFSPEDENKLTHVEQLLGTLDDCGKARDEKEEAGHGLSDKLLQTGTELLGAATSVTKMAAIATEKTACNQQPQNSAVTSNGAGGCPGRG